MPVTVSYPGVYVQEEASGARAISGVATSITLFIGMARKGRMDVPVRIFNFADFEREFGSETQGELADQVRQFYINGGGTAWVFRIANGAQPGAVTLQNEQGADCLTLTARDEGQEGNLIRAEVDYNTATPEQTFNLTVFRSRLQADGSLSREDVETFENVSMNPHAGNYVQGAVNGTSRLVTVEVETAGLPDPPSGISISGIVLSPVEATASQELTAAVTSNSNVLRISVDNSQPVSATLRAFTTLATIAADWQQDINDALIGNSVNGSVTVDIVGPGGQGVAGGRLLRIQSAGGPVIVTPAAASDASIPLGLGSSAGGIEGDSFGDFRPAPTGLVSRVGNSTNGFDRFREFAGQVREELTGFQLDDDSPEASHSNPGTDPIDLGIGAMFLDGDTTLLNARSVLDSLASAIGANTNGRWTVARTGFRLSLTPTYGNRNTGPEARMTTSGPVGSSYDMGGADQPFEHVLATPPANVAAYSVGLIGAVGGLGEYQGGAAEGLDGDAPLPPDYAAAYQTVTREIDLFNIMVLPRAQDQTDADRRGLWGAASAFCADQRAFLLIDPASWADVTAAEQGVDQLRIGVATRNAAVYWPQLRVPNGTAQGAIVDPSGAIAGLMARTDGNRGVWKAPAGLEATIRGVLGVQRRMNDPENGVINKKALNAIRVFPSGVVSWGARTLIGFDGSGNVDDKYVPVRRTMLFIEESLYRGLHFAVFEPNDEPLWAQIRLAAGSFMNGLFRQGAFAGAKASDAYFVRCDNTTTTPNDINLGIVNVIVGFAPLKPAEFVILTVKQIAGQIAT